MNIRVWKIGSRWSETGTPESCILDIFLRHKLAFAYGIAAPAQAVAEHMKTGGIALLAVADGWMIKAIGEVTEGPKPLSAFGEVFIDEEEDRFGSCTEEPAFRAKFWIIPEDDRITFMQPKRFASIDDEDVAERVADLYRRYTAIPSK